MTCGIYKITNAANSKSYIGSSVNIERRFKDHRRLLRKGKHTNIYLQNAWNRYDADYFLFFIVEKCEKADLLVREQFYVSQHDTEELYNLNKEVSRPPACSGVSAETREKLSKAHKGRVVSDETRKRLSDALKGHSTSEETKRKISAAHTGKKNEKTSRANKGRVISAETREKLSKINKGRRFSEEHRQKIADANRKRVVTEETKRKLSARRKRVRHTDEAKLKMSKAHKGRPHSDEHRRNLSEALRKWHSESKNQVVK